jgi:cellulose biosynthesis protein BcsQ
MLDVSQLKISELARITETSIPLISRHFKNSSDHLVTRKNERIVGLSAQLVEEYLLLNGFKYFYRPAVVLSANLCGGVGKTSSIISLGSAISRLTKDPIVYVDGDAQGSFTILGLGKPAEDDEPILIDFLEGKASIDDILTPVGDNIWFIKSNLNNAWIDKILSKPQEIKKGMLKLYEEIFKKLGLKTKIFQDHTPHLSNLFASSVCAITQLDKSILKSLLIPIRSDNFAISGAESILREVKELTDTFSLAENIDIHCFFSSIDKRVSTTAEAIRVVGSKENLIKHLSSVVIRYCSEIPKCIMDLTNIYASGKNNNAAQDYQDLLQYIFSYNQHKEA